MISRNSVARAAAVLLAAAALPLALPVSGALAAASPGATAPEYGTGQPGQQAPAAPAIPATTALSCRISVTRPEALPVGRATFVSFTTLIRCNKPASLRDTLTLSDGPRIGPLVPRKTERFTFRLPGNLTTGFVFGQGVPCRSNLVYQGTAAITATSGTQHATLHAATARTMLRC